MKGAQKMEVIRNKMVLFILIVCSIFLPRTVNAAEIPSANVPLGSYVYEYLDKLDGLGYMEGMRPGTKPYSRMQVAAWVDQFGTTMATRQDVPEYATALLARLQREFAPELDAGEDADGFTLHSVTLGGFFQSKESYQPMSSYNNGYKYSSSGNALLSANMEGKINDSLLLQLSPRIDYSGHETDITLESGYIKTSLGDAVLEVGKDSMQWGQAFRGGLLLTDNATPLNVAKITWADTTFFYSILETNRHDVKYPSFVGIRKDFQTGDDFTFGLAMTSMVGGEGHMLNHSDYGSWILGRNASGKASDKWNSIAGGDFRWRMPQLDGLQFYGEIYGEDQSHLLDYIPVPSEMAELAGIYLPRLSADGDWDARLEWAHTRSCWYRHSVYTEGYTYYNNIMGDAMGPAANRYSLSVTYYTPAESRFAFNLERVVNNAAGYGTTDSAWIAARCPCSDNLFLETTAGVARAKDPAATASGRINNYFAEVSLTAEW
jgi:hypothetical protein